MRWKTRPGWFWTFSGNTCQYEKMASLHLTEQHRDLFEAVASFSEEDLNRLAEVIERPRQLYTISRIVEAFDEFINDTDKVEAFIRLAFVIRSAPKKKKHLDRIEKEITSGLTGLGFGSSRIENVSRVIPTIYKFAISDLFEFSIKTNDIFYSNSYHLHKIKMYTKSNPVFNTERSKIIGYVLKTDVSLVIANKAEDEQLIDFSISLDQLRTLVEEAENAVSKLKLTSQNLESKTDLPIVSDLDGENHKE